MEDTHALSGVEGRRYGCWRPGLLAAIVLILLATTAVLVAWALGVSGPTLLLAVLISLVATLIIASICIEYQRRKANRQRTNQTGSMGWTLSGVRTVQNLEIPQSSGSGSGRTSWIHWKPWRIRPTAPQAEYLYDKDDIEPQKGNY